MGLQSADILNSDKTTISNTAEPRATGELLLLKYFGTLIVADAARPSTSGMKFRLYACFQSPHV